jgi:hypothetical protein
MGAEPGMALLFRPGDEMLGRTSEDLGAHTGVALDRERAVPAGAGAPRQGGDRPGAGAGRVHGPGSARPRAWRPGPGGGPADLAAGTGPPAPGGSGWGNGIQQQRMGEPWDGPVPALRWTASWASERVAPGCAAAGSRCG